MGRASSTAAPQLDCVSDGPIASTEVRISETKATAWSLVFLILTRSATPRQRDAARRLHNHDQIRMWFGDRAISHSIMDNDAGVSTAPQWSKLREEDSISSVVKYLPPLLNSAASLATISEFEMKPKNSPHHKRGSFPRTYSRWIHVSFEQRNSSCVVFMAFVCHWGINEPFLSQTTRGT